MAIPDNYIDKITKDGESRMISPAADKVRVNNEHYEGDNLDDVLDEIAEAIDEADSGDGTVKGVKVGSTTYEPDGETGVVDLSTPIAGKVDKVPGKGLSANDYTDADKAAVGTIPSKANAADVYSKSQVDTMVGGKQDVLQFDDAPTDNSNKMVKSGDIKQYVDDVLSEVTVAAIIEGDALGGGVAIANKDGVTNIVFGGAGGSLEFTAEPTIAVTGDSSSKTVTITNDAEEAGATIYYTTDGSTPTTSSSVYGEQFTISAEGTTTVKAIAVSTGKLPSSVVSAECYIEPTWEDGVKLDGNGVKVADSDMSLSKFIPLQGGGTVWVWNGLPYSKVGSSLAASVAIYDSEKNFIACFFSCNVDRIYNVGGTYNNKTTAYIRVAALTSVKGKVVVKKFTAWNTANPAVESQISSAGTILFAGSDIIGNIYDKVIPFRDYNDKNYFYLNPTGESEWTNRAKHYFVTDVFDMSKYTKIYVRHLTHQSGTSSQADERHALAVCIKANNTIGTFLNNGFTNGQGGYAYPDPREWPTPIQLETGTYSKFRYIMCSYDIHDVYLIGEWSDNGETKKEYVFRGCNVDVLEQEELNNQTEE